jgi:hypothetical protein
MYLANRDLGLKVDSILEHAVMHAVSGADRIIIIIIIVLLF